MHAYGAQPDEPTLYYKEEGNKKRRPNPGSESVPIVPKFGGPATGTIYWEDDPLGVLRVTGTFTPKQPLEAVKYALVTRPSVHAEESSGPNPSGEPVTFSGRVTFEDEVIITCSSGEQVDLVKRIEELQEQVKRCSQQRSEKADLAEWLEHQSREETISPGDVVYCRDGKITKRGSDLPGTMVCVVSTAPALVFNDKFPEEERPWWKECVTVGQVPVRVFGDAPNNAFLVPSGKGDGCAQAVSRDWLIHNPLFKEQCFGVVWGAATSKASPSGHIHYVHAFVVVGHPLFGAPDSSQRDISELVLCPERSEVEDEPFLELRGYQKEAIERAIEQNTILSLPTGKGKTICAVHVLDYFRRTASSQKVLFVVPTRVLVPQQADYILTHSRTTPRVMELCGQMVSEWSRAAWARLLSAHDVLCGTPEIFRRAFVDSGVLELEAVSLIIYDVTPPAKHARV